MSNQELSPIKSCRREDNRKSLWIVNQGRWRGHEERNFKSPRI